MPTKSNELEKYANAVNMDLRRGQVALIRKIPVPIEMTAKGLIVKQSTVDYSGTVYGGLSINYDAKETESKTSFPLSNIKEHQLNYLLFEYNLGAISFFMIHFKKVYNEKVFIVPVTFIKKFWDKAVFSNGRKSIPLKNFNKNWLTTLPLYLEKTKEMRNELRKNIKCS